MQAVKQASADLFPVWRIRLHAEGGKAAVAGNLCRDSLFDERAVVFLGILPIIEKIVVRMRIDQAGADLQTVQVHDPVGLFPDAAADRHNPVILNQNVADRWLCPGPVIDGSVPEQRSHD